MKEQKIKNKILFFSGLNFPQSIFHNFRDDVAISNILIILNTSGFGHTLCSVILNITLFIIKVQHKCHGQTQWFILEMKSIKQKFPFRAGIQFMLKNKCDYVINNLKKSNICKIYTVDIFKYSYFILIRLNNSFVWAWGAKNNFRSKKHGHCNNEDSPNRYMLQSWGNGASILLLISTFIHYQVVHIHFLHKMVSTIFMLSKWPCRLLITDGVKGFC